MASLCKVLYLHFTMLACRLGLLQAPGPQEIAKLAKEKEDTIAHIAALFNKSNGLQRIPDGVS